MQSKIVTLQLATYFKVVGGIQTMHSLRIYKIKQQMLGQFNQQPTNPLQNQFAPQQNQFGMQQNQFGSQQPQQFSFNGKQIHPQYVYQIQQIIDFINQAQAENNLRNLMFFMELETAACKDVVEKACKYDFAEGETPASQEQTRQRCVSIKERNAKIVRRMLDLRAKLTNNMNMFKTRSHEKEQEISLLLQKIRDLRSVISVKYDKLTIIRRNKKYNLVEENEENMMGAAQIPLLELRKGVQYLQRETIKMRGQIELVGKHIHNNAI